MGMVMEREVVETAETIQIMEMKKMMKMRKKNVQTTLKNAVNNHVWRMNNAVDGCGIQMMKSVTSSRESWNMKMIVMAFSKLVSVLKVDNFLMYACITHYW